MRALDEAFDDQTSTFIIPMGGGFEVVFCPPGRSTNILKTMSAQLHELAESGHVTPQIVSEASNKTYIAAKEASSRPLAALRPKYSVMLLLALSVVL